MVGRRILYVCYDPTLLVPQERLLLSRDYDVVTVLGTDGLIAHSCIGDYSAVVFGEGASENQLAQAMLWLQEHFSAIPVASIKQVAEDQMSQ
jgi:hypothetical protein